MAPLEVLAVSSDASVRQRLKSVLCGQAVSVAWVPNGRHCLAALEQAACQVLFLDIETEGVQDELVRQAVSIQPRLVVAILAERAAMGVARLRIRAAHTEFLEMPFADGAVQAVLARAAGAHPERGGNGNGTAPTGHAPAVAAPQASGGTTVSGSAAAALWQAAPAGGAPTAADAWNHAFAELAACSPAMTAVVELAERVAATDAAVLIQGEIGTGKALLAYHIHQQSRRAGGPFVRVACEAMREAEVDEMLFGSSPASSTQGVLGPAGHHGQENGDGQASHPGDGLLAAAAGGTLLLQNVARLPFATQVKLFDALPGGDRDWPSLPGACRSDVRIIALTRENLKTAVAEGRFYSGLYYLLDVVPVVVPPLRERREDIRRLAEHFLATVGRAWGLGERPYFSQQAWETLLAADWPGNARQLAAMVTRAVALSGGGQIPRECVAELLESGAPSQGAADTLCLPLAGGLRAMERWIIEEVIRRCRGNKAAAARTLGLHRRTLYRMLEEGGPTLAPAAASR
jgi:DNA-binding NtrC family response regulator